MTSGARRALAKVILPVKESSQPRSSAALASSALRAQQHPPGVGVGLHDVQAVPVGVPVVDDDGQVQLLGQGELGVEEVPGEGPVLWAFDPVVVQPHLADGLHPGVGGQSADLVQVSEGRPLQVLRVEPHGGVEIVVSLRQVHALLGALEIAAGADHQGHPLARQGGEEGVPVGVKGVVIIVGVGIEDHGSDLAFFILT